MIEKAVTDESLDEENFDYEEKCIYHAKMINKNFERFYVEEINL